MLSEHEPAIAVAVGVSSDRLLNADEVASMLGVPATWVREHSRNGHLPSVSLGRYVRYDAADVRDWIEKQKHGGAAWGKYDPTRSAP